MNFKTVESVLTSFELASRQAGHARNTRRTYLATVEEFATIIPFRRTA
jgi:hypothetical protein